MIRKDIPRSEYPRPDFMREQWMSLNGEWAFAYDDAHVGELEEWFIEKQFDKKIIVPFCYQSDLSGIGDTTYHPYIWYKKDFDIQPLSNDERVFIHFGAVDYKTKVWMNGHYLGEHIGGYTPFSFDITPYSHEKNTITIMVEDSNDCSQPRGKQYWKEKPDRCWYTPTSGIWQSVWLETVGATAIDHVRITPDIDQSNVFVELYLDTLQGNLELEVTVSYEGILQNKLCLPINRRISKLTIDLYEIDSIDEIHYWTPDNPNLYDIRFILRKNGVKVDDVKSYFGMRKISVRGEHILLNNKPFYQKLVLDQGYWKESLLTPPSDEAIKYDIMMTKELGFNGARKHQKIEDPRYYYWADKLGLLVWGEIPSAYDFNTKEIKNIIDDSLAFIDRDYNHPCLIAWVPLNESWGVRNIISNKRQQSFASSLYYLFKSMDQTRIVSSNDGWEQVKDTDICAIHDYNQIGASYHKRYADRDKLLSLAAERRLIYADKHGYTNIPVLITEYGGIAFESNDEEEWGYYESAKSEEDFLSKYQDITHAIMNIPYINGYCYTQLTDVFQEANGLMTMDRQLKVNKEAIRKINQNSCIG